METEQVRLVVAGIVLLALILTGHNIDYASIMLGLLIPFRYTKEKIKKMIATQKERLSSTPAVGS